VTVEADNLRGRVIEYLQNEQEADDERAAIQSVESQQEQTHPQSSDPDSPRLETISLARIAAKAIVPIWPGVLYRGKTTVIAGVPGDGKSLLSNDIAARKSAGQAWPCGRGQFEQGCSMFMTAEDDPADTLRPRFDAAGANTDLIELVRGVSRLDHDGKRVLDTVSLIEDLPRIEEKLIQLVATLLVIDPLTSFADADTNKTAPMRVLLDRVSQMAARTGVAVLVVTHLNKRSDARKALQLVAGSHIITAAVRVALVTARDPNDRHRRLLLPIKLNIDSDDGGFAFRIVVQSHAICGNVPRIEWEPERVADLTADEALIDSTPRAQAAVEKATEVQDWLRDLLRFEAVLATTIWSQAKEKKFSERRVRAALKSLKATCEVLGFQGRWHYRLPDSDGKGTHA
jgi:putative DNA primase/helicase